MAVSTSCINPLVGPGTLINVKFTAVGASGTNSVLSFSPFIFNGGTPTNTSNTGSITILGTTAAGASISGRVSSAGGKPIGNAMVALTGLNGMVRSARTSLKGLYRFEDVRRVILILLLFPIDLLPAHRR